ncbi:MAG: 3-isopropylmalate dehydratase small subunit [Methanomassiliicoccales archaeon]|jgi:3-isopropylmalate dehydratase small subunit|nr:3-isopropylmalate dehydratase small subunit [Methanomassiliicoccales archaeon]
MIKGRVWKYGDHINTDLIISGRYLDEYDMKSLSAHVFEDLDPTFTIGVKPGDIIVAGRNFGCGSSREQAPAVLKEKRVGAIVAASFARIFFRNAINIGLPVVICPDAHRILNKGDVITLDIRGGFILREPDGTRIRFNPLPDFLVDILEKGGLVPYMRAKLGRCVA